MNKGEINMTTIDGWPPPASEKQSCLNTTRAYGMGGGLFHLSLCNRRITYRICNHCYGQDYINEGVGFCGMEVTTIMIWLGGE